MGWFGLALAGAALALAAPPAPAPAPRSPGPTVQAVRPQPRPPTAVAVRVYQCDAGSDGWRYLRVGADNLRVWNAARGAWGADACRRGGRCGHAEGEFRADLGVGPEEYLTLDTQTGVAFFHGETGFGHDDWYGVCRLYGGVPPRR